METKQMKRKKVSILFASALFLFGIIGSANATPTLQLDADPAIFVDGIDPDTVATSDIFTLYALLDHNKIEAIDTDWENTYNFFIAAALTPPTADAGNYGSFEFDGEEINVTTDMVFGTPPVALLADDIPPGGLYETYYKEFAIEFDVIIT